MANHSIKLAVLFTCLWAQPVFARYESVLHSCSTYATAPSPLKHMIDASIAAIYEYPNVAKVVFPSLTQQQVVENLPLNCREFADFFVKGWPDEIELFFERQSLNFKFTKEFDLQMLREYEALKKVKVDLTGYEGTIDLEPVLLHRGLNSFSISMKRSGPGLTAGQIKSLVELKNLESLWIWGTNIPNGQVFVNAHHLRDIVIENSDFSDPSVFFKLINLRNLRINRTNIKDVSALMGLANLISLDLSGNKDLRDIEGIKSLANLRYLSINNCGLSDISPLTSLFWLKSLSAMGNKIADLTPLTRMKRLEILYLGFNNISDVTPLASLPKLRMLGLTSNRITSIEPLDPIRKNLQFFSYEENPLE